MDWPSLRLVPGSLKCSKHWRGGAWWKFLWKEDGKCDKWRDEGRKISWNQKKWSKGRERKGPCAQWRKTYTHIDWGKTREEVRESSTCCFWISVKCCITYSSEIGFADPSYQCINSLISFASSSKTRPSSASTPTSSEFQSSSTFFTLPSRSTCTLNPSWQRYYSFNSGNLL